MYFLIISAVLNVFGDLFFVVVLKAGCNGCAVSTVLSEALCCLFCVIYIQKKVPILRLGKKWLVFDASLLKRTIAYGWASAMQQATVQLGKIGIQAIVNTMGVSVAAAFAVVNRIDDFAYTPEQNIATCDDGTDGTEQRGRKERPYAGRIPLWIYIGSDLWNLGFDYLLCVCKTAYDAVCKR